MSARLAGGACRPASYLACLARYPAFHMAAFTFWTPIFGLLAGWLLLAEPVTSWLAVAILLVAAGIYLVNRTPTATARRASL